MLIDAILSRFELQTIWNLVQLGPKPPQDVPPRLRIRTERDARAGAIFSSFHRPHGPSSSGKGGLSDPVAPPQGILAIGGSPTAIRSSHSMPLAHVDGFLQSSERFSWMAPSRVL